MSTIKTETLSTPSNATVPVDTVVNGTAKAWVNFNGTGTVAIRRAFNVSSITDNATGKYTVNFTTAMPDANYAAVVYNNAASGTSSVSFNNNYTGGAGDRTTTSISLASFTTVYSDSELFDVVIFS